MTAKQPTGLRQEDIWRGVSRRVRRYSKLSFLEQFAMFIGTAQVLELGLKQLLARRYNHNLEEMEKWTLGRTAKKLKRYGLQQDFVALLESVVRYRNYVVHELLINDAIIKMLVGNSGTLESKSLRNAIWELEQAVFLHDWLEQHDAWDVPLAQQTGCTERRNSV